MIKYAVFILLGIITFTQVEDYELHNWLFIGAVCLALVFNLRFVNISSLLIIILVFRLVELLLWNLLETENNYIIFPSYILMEGAALIGIYFRIHIFAKLELLTTKNLDVGRYQITNADMLLGLIYAAYLFLALLALFEHILRNIEDFGLPASPWLFENARIVLYNYQPIKGVLNILELTAVLATAHRFMHSNHFVRA